jgi:hypothetical protein
VCVCVSDVAKVQGRYTQNNKPEAVPTATNRNHILPRGLSERVERSREHEGRGGGAGGVMRIHHHKLLPTNLPTLPTRPSAPLRKSPLFSFDISLHPLARWCRFRRRRRRRRQTKVASSSSSSSSSSNNNIHHLCKRPRSPPSPPNLKWQHIDICIFVSTVLFPPNSVRSPTQTTNNNNNNNNTPLLITAPDARGSGQKLSFTA